MQIVVREPIPVIGSLPCRGAGPIAPPSLPARAATRLRAEVSAALDLPGLASWIAAAPSRALAESALLLAGLAAFLAAWAAI